MSRDYDWRDITDQYPLAVQLRIPLVSSPYPSWCYITAVVVDSRDGADGLYGGVRPSDAELHVIGSFHEQYLTWYDQTWLDRMARQPFDIDGGANGRYLIKHRERGWGYRKASWTQGAVFVWQPGGDLLGLLDRVHGAHVRPESISPKWLEWKTQHRDLFSEEPASG